MLLSIFTSQLSPLFFYFFNLLKRFSDSKYSNGKTTKLTDILKYEKIYVGPEFPFAERYAKLFINLSISLLFGVNCPVIYFFFLGYLIVTFVVDKFLIINYYKKPKFYGTFLSQKVINYLFLGTVLYLYGLIYNISNPYLFNNELLKNNFEYFFNSFDILDTLYYFFNPITLIYTIYCDIFVPYYHKKSNFLYYNFNTVFYSHLVIFIVLFLDPISTLKKKLTPKNKTLSFLNISSVEIGAMYSLEELQKYYNIKKLQLFNLIIECDKNNKIKDDYSYLINNYMSVIKYLKKNIDKKYEKPKKIINTDSNNIEDEYIPLKDDNFIDNNNYLHITGEISYNQSFIPKYEIYNNFSLMKNI